MSIQGIDFWEEETVREIGRNMLRSASKLSFQIGAIARGHGPSCSAALSAICGIGDRGKRDRTSTDYTPDIDACVDHLDDRRFFNQKNRRSETITLDELSEIINESETPLGLYTFGKNGIADYKRTNKFPTNQLPLKKINGLEEEDSDDE